MLKILVFGLFNMAVLSACPPDDVDGLARVGFSEVYERIRAETLARMRAKHSDIADVRVVPLNEGTLGIEVDLQDGIVLPVPAYFEGSEHGHSYNYDTGVDVPYRGLGVQRLMLAHFLLSRPHLTRADFSLLGTNQLSFLVSVLDGPELQEVRQRTRSMDEDGGAAMLLRRRFATLSARFDTTEQVQDFRRRVIEAVVNHTAAGRNQAAVGMGKLKKVVVGLHRDPAETLDVAVEFERGDFTEEDALHVEVLVAEMGEYEFLRGHNVPYLRLLNSGLIQTKMGVVHP